MKKIIHYLSRPLLLWILLSLLLNLSFGTLFSQTAVSRTDNPKCDAEEHVSLRVVNMDSSVREQTTQYREALDGLGCGDPHTSTSLLNPSVYIDPSLTDLEVDPMTKTSDEVFQLFLQDNPDELLFNNSCKYARDLANFIPATIEQQGLDLSYNDFMLVILSV